MWAWLCGWLRRREAEEYEGKVYLVTNYSEYRGTFHEPNYVPVEDSFASKQRRRAWEYFRRFLRRDSFDANVSNEATADEANRLAFLRGSRRSNIIRTTKYSLLSFLPRVMLFQLTRVGNLIFLGVSFLQLIEEISDSNGLPTYLIPLVFVIAVCLGRELASDLARWRSDQEENGRLVRVFRDGRLVQMKQRDIRVGDVVKVHAYEYFPSDLVLLNCCGDNGVCNVETKNVDGESNVKYKHVVPELAALFRNDEDAAKAQIKIQGRCGGRAGETGQPTAARVVGARRRPAREPLGHRGGRARGQPAVRPAAAAGDVDGEHGVGLLRGGLRGQADAAAQGVHGHLEAQGLAARERVPAQLVHGAHHHERLRGGLGDAGSLLAADDLARPHVPAPGRQPVPLAAAVRDHGEHDAAAGGDDPGGPHHHVGDRADGGVEADQLEPADGLQREAGGVAQRPADRGPGAHHAHIHGQDGDADAERHDAAGAGVRRARRPGAPRVGEVLLGAVRGARTRAAEGDAGVLAGLRAVPQRGDPPGTRRRRRQGLRRRRAARREGAEGGRRSGEAGRGGVRAGAVRRGVAGRAGAGQRGGAAGVRVLEPADGDGDRNVAGDGGGAAVDAERGGFRAVGGGACGGAGAGSALRGPRGHIVRLEPQVHDGRGRGHARPPAGALQGRRQRNRAEAAERAGVGGGGGAPAAGGVRDGGPANAGLRGAGAAGGVLRGVARRVLAGAAAGLGPGKGHRRGGEGAGVRHAAGGLHGDRGPAAGGGGRRDPRPEGGGDRDLGADGGQAGDGAEHRALDEDSERDDVQRGPG
ncbi:P-type ATPase, putative [Babesia caballi]|uniref:P-type ATPase, putative n=1 Tax=Babesia caballi TaxID=5871 RepID=A0AAV4LP01_BABCB|nr:P-type ATPase, putative [Babesia caballi]